MYFACRLPDVLNRLWNPTHVFGHNILGTIDTRSVYLFCSSTTRQVANASLLHECYCDSRPDVAVGLFTRYFVK